MEEGVVSDRSKTLKLLIVIFLAVFSIIVVFFLLTAFVTFGSIVYRGKTDTQKEKIPSHRYKYLSLNPSNETSSGVMSIHKELGEEEYLSYQDEDGTLNLVSNFGSHEYECSGSCYCDEDVRSKKRRSIAAGALAVRSLKFLVAAVSSVVVLDLAKDQFREKCEQTMSQAKCPSDFIISNLERCDDIQERYDGQYRKFSSQRTYWCQGCCMAKNFRRTDMQEKAEFFGCEDLCKEGWVDIDVKDIPIKDQNSFARSKFQRVFLTKFCKDSSEKKVTYAYTRSRKNHIANLCVGGKTRLNVSIYCRAFSNDLF